MPLFAFFTLLYALCACSLPAAAQEALRVAIALPLSGPHQTLGHEIRRAVELTITDLAGRSDPDAPRLEISWHDDRCSIAGGLEAARAIVSLGEAATKPVVIGHACPSAASAASPVYGAAGIVHLIAGQLPTRGADTRRLGPLQFRMFGGGEQGRIIGAALAEQGPEARIAFVRDRTAFATSTMQAVQSALSARQRTPASVETFAGGDKDFSALAQRLKATRITHVALAAFPSEAGLLVAEVRTALPGIVIIAADTLADPAFARIAGPAADGVQVALTPDVKAFPRAQAITKRLAEVGLPASRPALASAAALEIVAQAVQRARGENLAMSLADTTFDTVLGPISFQADGTANLPSHVLYTWRAGDLRPPS